MIAEMKVCPECAEDVKAAAKLCRFCGHHFVSDYGFAVIDTSKVTSKDDEITAKAKANRPLYAVIAVLVTALVLISSVMDQQEATVQRPVPDSTSMLTPITEDSKEKRRRGLHCLDGPDGSNLAVIEAVKSQLVDPDSFQHIKTTIYPTKRFPARMLEHRLIMQFRSRNGFNGMVRGEAVAEVNQVNCDVRLQTVS